MFVNRHILSDYEFWINFIIKKQEWFHHNLIASHTDKKKKRKVIKFFINNQWLRGRRS